jgi:hypothetical protein
MLEIPFTPQDGKPPASVLHRLLDAISRAGDKRLVLTLKEQKKRRSLLQNAMYWGYIVPPITAMFRENGNMVDDEDVHDFLKMRVGKLAQIFVTPDGEVLKGLGSTAKLSTTEFSNYIECVKAWGAQYGVQFPPPDKGIT